MGSLVPLLEALRKIKTQFCAQPLGLGPRNVQNSQEGALGKTQTGQDQKKIPQGYFWGWGWGYSCIAESWCDVALFHSQTVVPALSGVLQSFIMSGVVGVVCPELQDSLLKAFAEVDPPNSRVQLYVTLW